MTRAETAALLASLYLGLAFVWHRVRIARRRRTGPSLGTLRRFDYRVLWNAALPPAAAAVGMPGRSSPGCGSPIAPERYRSSPWELENPPCLKGLRDELRSGASPRMDSSDPSVAWLGWHFVIRRMLSGELESARSLAERLSDPLRTPLVLSVEMARADALQAAGNLGAARGAAMEVLSRASRWKDGGGAADYVVAHARLTWLTHFLNLEFSVASALRQLRSAVRQQGERPWLLLEQAHAHALLGRHEEALDAMGKALYHSQGDRFYAGPILEGDFVATARPALHSRCRELAVEREGGPLPPSTPED